MTNIRSVRTYIVLGISIVCLSVAGCGVKGQLETPPPKDEKDEMSLVIDQPGNRA